jgi:hypothetical protein
MKVLEGILFLVALVTYFWFNWKIFDVNGKDDE